MIYDAFKGGIHDEAIFEADYSPWLRSLLLAAGISLHSQAQTQNQPPSPACSRSDEMLDRWNDIRNKLVVMAQDFPEDMSVRTSRYHP
jgi:hypothetical protein